MNRRTAATVLMNFRIVTFVPRNIPASNIDDFFEDIRISFYSKSACSATKIRCLAKLKLEFELFEYKLF